MSDEEYDDELPPIAVNGSDFDSSCFSMPSAAETAARRREEQARDREVRLVLSQHAAPAAAAPPAAAADPHALVAGILEGNSSGSEGESGLRATLEHLRVSPSPRGAAAPATTPQRLLAALREEIASEACREFLLGYEKHLENSSKGRLQMITDELLVSTELALPGSCAAAAWRHDDVLTCAGWLCVTAHFSHVSQRMARALWLRFLHDVVTCEQARQLSAWLCAAVSDLRLLLRVSDGVGTGGGGIGTSSGGIGTEGGRIGTSGGGVEMGGAHDGGRYFVKSVLEHCLSKLLDLRQEDVEDESLVTSAIHSSWRSLSPSDKYLLVQCIGRGSAAGAARAARGALAAVTAGGGARTHPDLLKVAVAASKLRLLFRDQR